MTDRADGHSIAEVAEDREVDQRGEAADLLGQLAHELSLLVRNDLELAASERLPELRRLGVELAAAVAAGVALLLCLAGLSWAVVRALDRVLPDWSAPLVVAFAWAAVAGMLLALEHPRRLLARLRAGGNAQIIASARQSRREAEQTLRTTAERLTREAARTASEHAMRAAASLAERELRVAEAGAGHLLRGLIDALTAPGRVGIGVLERLTGQQPTASGHERRRSRRAAD